MFQIIYPHSVEDMKKKGVTDEDLRQLLIQVRLEQLLDREVRVCVVAARLSIFVQAIILLSGMILILLFHCLASRI